MVIEINPNVLSGTVRAPFSKSDAHRVLIASALCRDSTEICLSCESDDIQATVRCLEALGASLLEIGENRFRMNPILPQRGTLLSRLDCGESGTTLRLLLPVAAALGVNAEFAAQGRLPNRPLTELIAEITNHGCRFDGEKLPFTLNGKLTAGDYNLPGNVSSQYISGLLFALALTDGESRIILTTKLESAAYVAMTLNTLRAFDVNVSETDYGYFIAGNQDYKSPDVTVVEGDWSNAAFFLAAGVLGNPVTVTGLSESSLQGDKTICELLSRFGADVSLENDAVTVNAGELRGIDIDVSEVPDLFPVLAVVASAASGTTRLMNAARLRIKESDRIHTVANMLSSLGAKVQEKPDMLIIHGKGHLDGASVDGGGDHRIVMAAAVASLLCKTPVRISGAEAVNKSYPQFFNAFNAIGGNAYRVGGGQEV